MALNPLPMPMDTPMVNKDRTIEFSVWVPYFVAQDQQLANAAQTIVNVQTPSTEAAAIGATSLPVGNSGGFYRANIYARITQAATVSSSLTPTIRWTEGGVAQVRSLPAMTGNTTTTLGLDVFPLLVDANTSVTYETAYASVGATSMNYLLKVAIERLA